MDETAQKKKVSKLMQKPRYGGVLISLLPLLFLFVAWQGGTAHAHQSSACSSDGEWKQLKVVDTTVGEWGAVVEIFGFYHSSWEPPDISHYVFCGKMEGSYSVYHVSDGIDNGTLVHWTHAACLMPAQGTSCNSMALAFPSGEGSGKEYTSPSPVNGNGDHNDGEVDAVALRELLSLDVFNGWTNDNTATVDTGVFAAPSEFTRHLGQ